MISFKIKVPEMVLELENRDAVIEAMTAKLAASVSERTNRGEGVQGKLPQPKDGGDPLNASGSLRASIGYVMRKNKKGEPYGVVRALGPRPKDERTTIRAKKAAAKKRTVELRANAQAAYKRTGRVVFRGVIGRWASARVGFDKKGKLKLGRLRVRTVTDQGSLAGILSVSPRDPNGIVGRRGIYRVFAARDSEVRDAHDIAQRSLSAKIRTTGNSTEVGK